jgi:hypothetical protein
MAYFTLAAVSVHVKAGSICRRAVNVTLRCGTTLFFARAQPLQAAARPMAVHNKAFSSAVPTNGTPNVVLVKVGAREYSPLSLKGKVLNMNSTEILDALATSRIFANKLKNVPLDDCKVSVLPSVAGNVPTPAEERAANELKESNEISSHFVDEKGVERVPQTVALRVELPTSAGELYVTGASASNDLLTSFLWQRSGTLSFRVIHLVCRRRWKRLMPRNIPRSTEFI